jgi:hypothetical protein
MKRLALLIALLAALVLFGCRGSLSVGGTLFGGGDDDDSATGDDDDAADDDDVVDDDDVQPDDDDIQPDDDDIQPDDDDVQPDDDDAAPECVPDSHEPNDGQNAASPLPEGDHDLTMCGDDDWFELCWDGGDYISLRLWFDHEDGDIDVTLHTPDGQVIFTAESGNDNEVMEFEVPFEGCRYLRVYLYDDMGPNPGNSYEFEHEID